MSNEVSQFSLKYRPRKLEDVYGQDTIVKALHKRILDNDFPTATCFVGLTGTGKTTLAEMYAAAMQSHDDKGNPNWDDPSCKAILNGTFNRDTIRLDGSQFSGKSDVVDATQDINTRPIYDKYKIILLEEVDQISQAGMKSLLKVLETPKPYVKFILLSMDNKIPAAILNRCQVYRMKDIGVKDIMFNLKSIMEKEGLWNDPNIPDTFRLEGLSTIAKLAKGSMRDAVQMLENALTSELYTAEAIDEFFGIIDEEKTWKILDGLLEKTKDENIWRTIIGFKSGDEAQHFLNYSQMLLSEALIAKETGCVYDESARSRLLKMASSPYAEDLFYCLSLHPQLTKPYVKTTDIVGALVSFYQGISFKPKTQQERDIELLKSMTVATISPTEEQSQKSIEKDNHPLVDPDTVIKTRYDVDGTKSEVTAGYYMKRGKEIPTKKEEEPHEFKRNEDGNIVVGVKPEPKIRTRVPKTDISNLEIVF